MTTKKGAERFWKNQKVLRLFECGNFVKTSWLKVDFDMDRSRARQQA